MPFDFDAAGYPTYVPTNSEDDDYYLRPVVPAPRHSPTPSPQASPNLSPMYLDEYYNYVQPGTGVVGVPMIPAGLMPLPPSPSMLAATFVPLPPSPNVSPRLGPVPLTPVSPGGMLGAYPTLPHPRYTYLYDRYYFPQGMTYYHRPFGNFSPLPKAGTYYQNPQYPPRANVHPLLRDTSGTRLDLSSHSYAPQMLTSNWPRRKYSAIHRDYLSQPATYPVAHEIKIICNAFGPFADSWAIRVTPGRTVTVGEVLHAIHSSIYKKMTHAEFARFSDEEMYEIGKAYTLRIRNAEFERVQGARRVDVLGKKHWFGGLRKIRDDDPHRFELLVKAE
ncbi:hypothetical protein ACEPAH_1431 [Sanghuangporus vaninii]